MSRSDWVLVFRTLRDFLLGGMTLFAVAAATGAVVVSIIEGNLGAGWVWIAGVGLLAALTFVMRSFVLVFFVVIFTPVLGIVALIAPGIKKRQAWRDAQEWLRRRPPYEPT